MIGNRELALIVIAVSSSLASALMMDASLWAVRRGALEWRRGCLLERDAFPGSFRLGVLMMQGAALGFLFGTAQAISALLNSGP